MDVLVANTADEWAAVVSGCFVPLDCAATSRTSARDGVRADGRVRRDLACHHRRHHRGSHAPGTPPGRTTTTCTSRCSGGRAASSPRTAERRGSARRRHDLRDGRAVLPRLLRAGPAAGDHPDLPQLLEAAGLRSSTMPAADCSSRGSRNAHAVPIRPRRPDARRRCTDPQVAEVMRDLTAHDDPVLVLERPCHAEHLTRTQRHGAGLHAPHYRREALTMAEVAERTTSRAAGSTRCSTTSTRRPPTTSGSCGCEEVARLLADLSMHRTISTIARDSGFGDATTLTRAFRRQFGMIPHEYRARTGTPSAA